VVFANVSQLVDSPVYRPSRITHLASAVLTHHDNNLRVGEAAGLDAQLEVAERLLHGRVTESPRLLGDELLGPLSNAEGQAFLTETQVLGRDVAVQEDVDAFADRVRMGNDTVNGGLAVENADVIREVVEHGQIVLDDDDIVVGTQERPDDAGSAQSLLDIEVRRRLIEHVTASGSATIRG